MITEPPANILVRGTNWVGDAVMTLPAVSALAAAFPQSRLSVLTRPWAAGVYEHHPQVAEVIGHDRDGAHRGLIGRFKLAGQLKRRGFDLAVLFQNAFEAALMAFMARAPERWGYARDSRSFLMTKAIRLEPADRFIHESFYYLNILERAGLPAPFSLPRLTPKPEAARDAEQLFREAGLKEGEFWLALAPGAAFGSAKRWPVENFAEAARLILDEAAGQGQGRALILGGQGEMDVAAELAALLPDRALNVAGRTSLAVSLGLLKRADLLLANDSGLMHLGGALGVPLAAAFGPTNPLTTAPLGRSRLVRSAAPCSPCLKRECPLPRRICFDGVTPELMAAEALSLLENSSSPGLRPAVFLDRDGTINVEVDFLSRPEDLRLIDGAAEAVAALNKAGLAVVVVSNQSGLARGLFTSDDLAKVQRRLEELMAEKGARIDGFYFCPHHPAGSVPELAIDCDCRKPAPGLFQKAAAELSLDPARSFWVGDRLRDLKASAAFKGRSVLVLTGYGLSEVQKPMDFQPSLVAPDLRRAAEWVVAVAAAGLGASSPQL
ncbi:lipopolysaccharide heptosyltransferase II [Deltaproteobacteria bacterium OttesenSCG-928-M10]|nr:lipopolysaccharide heptosyltransferase II [Deltaproteobacteria bacterium OttesenSCG-928-M10]